MAFEYPKDHSLTLASSDPEAKSFGSTELKSTLQQRLSCSWNFSIVWPLKASQIVTEPS